MSLFKILKGTQSKEIDLQLFGFSNGLFGFGMATTNALQIFGRLTWCMQEDKILFNKDFKANQTAKLISSGHKESGPTFPLTCACVCTHICAKPSAHKRCAHK